MKKLILFIILALLLLAGIILFNTNNFKPTKNTIQKVTEVPVRAGASQRLAEAISIRTISFENEEDFDSTQFALFNEFLQNNYPLLHEKAEHKTFNEFSHLFKLNGSQSQLKPVILMGHHDVVPIASPALWSVHPFTEGIKNDTVYGRGTIDDKGAVISLLEAVEQLLEEGFAPKRTIYFAFGHDEEVSGHKGAQAIVKHLKAEGVKAEMVFDEGGAITSGLVPGLAPQAALIGVAEKGYTSFELSVLMGGGHSSQPASETSIDVLAGAISTLKKNPLPRKLTPVLESFMDNIGPHMDFKSRMAFSNRWLLGSMILDQYEKSAQGNASIRTTTSPTIFEAGIKENVIPTIARAVVNFRIIPGETVESVKQHIINTINDDRITVEVKGLGSNPSPISPTDHNAYRLITQSINEIYPDVITTPNLVVGATDSRYYTDISPNIYRFTPFILNTGNINCFHGVDERISVAEFENGIRFYRRVIENVNSVL